MCWGLEPGPGAGACPRRSLRGDPPAKKETHKAGRMLPDVAGEEMLVVESPITQGADLGEDVLVDALRPAAGPGPDPTCLKRGRGSAGLGLRTCSIHTHAHTHACTRAHTG